MNARTEPWPRADEIAQWWADRAMAPPTPEELEAMREEYERACIDDANSAAEYAANLKEFSK